MDKQRYEGCKRNSTDLNLKVRIARWNHNLKPGEASFDWVISNRTFKSIAEAKEGANKLLESNPKLMHPEYYNEV